jgi:surface protein
MIYNFIEEYNNITLIWNSPLNSTQWMFCGVKNITKIVISHFDSTKLKKLNSMFANVDLLTSIDLSNLDTSLVTNFDYLFYGCISLKSLDLSNFKTSNAISMMQMFYNCKSLIYLNLKYFTEENLSDTSSMFFNVGNSLIYCIDETKTPKITSKIQSISSNNNCSDTCFIQPAIFLFNENKCISCYEQNNLFLYKYNNECVQSCPKRTRINLYNNYSCVDLYCEKYYNYNQTDCLEEIPEGYFLNDSYLKTIDKCNYYYSGKCFSECINDTNNNLICKDLFEQNCTEYLINKDMQDLCIYCYNGTG